MGKVIFMGTNGFYDTETGNTISILIDTEKYYIVLDAGNGFGKLDKYFKEDKPVYLFLSHFHLDHIEGLHTLGKNNFSRGVSFILQHGGTEILNNFLRRPYAVSLCEYNFSSAIIEVPKYIDQLPFKAEVLPMVHADYTLGIRMELDGKIIAFCPDTGFCENAVALAKDADLLITECAYLPGQNNPGWPHLNPQSAAQIARESGTKKLVMTHFDPTRYTDIHLRYEGEKKAREIFEFSYVSIDGMEIEV